MHAISSYRGNRPTNTPTHPQTGPITIHCAVQCNKIEGKEDPYNIMLSLPPHSEVWVYPCGLTTPTGASGNIFYCTSTLTLSLPLTLTPTLILSQDRVTDYTVCV